MVILKNIISLFLLFTVFGFSNEIIISKDNYPKNPLVDAINYSFNIELSDNTDEIICETSIDIKFLGSGVKKLRFDLITN